MAGEGGGGSRPILTIPIDDSAWQEFLRQFGDYQKKLSEQGDAWEPTNKGVKQLSTAFDDAGEAFDKLAETATSSKLTGQSNGAFSRISKDSRETSKSWTLISKEIEKSGRSLSGLMRDGSKLSSLFSLFGLGTLGTLAVGAFSGVLAANNSLADQNIMNRKLGLKPGEERAFDTVYEKTGGDSSLLAKVANAQSTPSQWRYLQAAGISTQDIQSKDSAALSAELLQKVGEKVRQFGPQQFGQWLQGTGVGQLIDPNSARLAGSYNAKDFADMAQQFGELTPKLAASQKAMDEATKAHQDFSAALAQDELALAKAFQTLNPLMLDAAGKVTDFITAFVNNGELAKDITAVETAFGAVDTAAQWLADKLNRLFGLDDKHPKDNSPSVEPGGPADKGLTWLFGNYRNHDQSYNAGEKSVPGGDNAWDYYTKKLKGGNASANGFDSSNNPGNVRDSSGTGFQKYASPEAGIKGADANMSSYWTKYGINTPKGIVTRWAPPSENDTSSYIRDVAKRTGLDPDKPIDMTDPKMRALLLSAMFAHEGRKGFTNLTPDQILAVENGQSLSPFDDPKAVKKLTASSPQIVPSTSDDKKAKDAGINEKNGAEKQPLIDRILRGLGIPPNVFSEGGGSGYRTEDRTQQRIDRQGNQPYSPYNINVTVSAPAGNSAVVTAGGIAQ
ncbi:hypothetical protein [Paraburkholderia xenovorans]|uniref:hypothetical protein n=1 Tax=Paraburkholderia xenovorans TaxID=36873 RepID=UPI0015C55409|nr:hypothetical protein [Paraburkholderia xenovorans]NPT36329.1 hypothetical protein [Paraburkholderia xenovorans]